MPFGRGKKFVNSDSFWVNLLVGNWTISAVQQYRTGALLLVQAPANTLGTGVLFTQFKKANVGRGPIMTGIDRTTLDPRNPATRWLNAAAFTAPGQFELGNASQYYGDFRQPGVFRRELSIHEANEVPDSQERTIDLVYHADAFNMFNRTTLGASSARSATWTSDVLPGRRWERASSPWDFASTSNRLAPQSEPKKGDWKPIAHF